MKWLAIESAPKDGTKFLGVINGQIDFFYWQHHRQLSSAPAGWRDSFIKVYPEGEGPTHWMPLPPPPGADDAG